MGSRWSFVCGIESSRRRLRAVSGAVARSGAYGCGEPLAESAPVLHPGHLQEVSPRSNATYIQPLLAEARAKRLERIEGAVRVVNDVRQVLAIEESADEGA